MPEVPAALVSCEHGGNRIPPEYQALFSGQEALLDSHRGWDPGALALARALARTLGAPLFFSTVSRLLVDLNRSPHHPRLFSSITRHLPKADRDEILDRWYWPYRDRVKSGLRERVDAGAMVVHLSVHTFTPVLDGRVREVDIGILYDPAREVERELCRRLKARLGRILRASVGNDGLRIRANQPYRGTSDGLTTFLRKAFSPTSYAGIELEVNQEIILDDSPRWRSVRRGLLKALVLEDGDAHVR